MTQTYDPIETYILEITNKCNEKCGFCYSVSYDATKSKARIPKQLKGSEWVKGLEQIAKSGSVAVDFSGGEPTLHPDFPEIVKRAYELGLYTILSTNGATNGNQKIRDSIDSYVDCVALSMHGVGQTHDEIKGLQGSYERVKEAYNHFIKSGKKVKVNTVACRQNMEDLINIGKAIDIENSPAQWKISQAIPRESGLVNKKDMYILQREFEKIQKAVKISFPKTYQQGRLTFREDDSDTKKHSFVPYMIVDSSGQLRVPVGTEHINIGVNIQDNENINTKIYEKTAQMSGFSGAVRDNHKIFYDTPYQNQQFSQELLQISPKNKTQIKNDKSIVVPTCISCDGDKLKPTSNCSYICTDCGTQNDFCGE